LQHAITSLQQADTPSQQLAKAAVTVAASAAKAAVEIAAIAAAKTSIFFIAFPFSSLDRKPCVETYHPYRDIYPDTS
jgi:hypothetical protein